MDDGSLNFPRILEEVNGIEETPNPPSLMMSPDKISFGMGNILGSLSFKANAMILSKSKKLAFVTIESSGTLCIIDLSDMKSPFILSSLSLESEPYYYLLKNLILSSDEKMLYASNSKILEIIDVTDLYSPKLISRTKSGIFGQRSVNEEVIRDSKTSLAVSESKRTLYIGGLGLQVYDISDLKKPVLWKGFRNEKESQGNSRNEICLSPDGKVLLIANVTLDIYNISNPKEMKLMHSFKTESSPRSIMLSEDFKTAFLLGTSRNSEIIFEEADISNLESLKVRNTVHLGFESIYSPRFLAISPSKSKPFFF